MRMTQNNKVKRNKTKIINKTVLIGTTTIKYKNLSVYNTM